MGASWPGCLRLVVLWGGTIAALNVLAGPGPALLAAVAGAGLAAWAILAGRKSLLTLLRAQPADPLSWPGLWRIMNLVASRLEVPCPALHVSRDPVPWACTLSDLRDGPTVVASRGLVELLETEELEAVLAHELAHVEARDAGWATFVASLASAPQLMMKTWLLPGRSPARGRTPSRRSGTLPTWARLVMGAGPALVVQLALDRRLDLEADRRAVVGCGNPMALASALARLEEAVSMAPSRPFPDATLHLFTLDPVSGPPDPVRELHRVWASTSERVGRLEELAGNAP